MTDISRSEQVPELYEVLTLTIEEPLQAKRKQAERFEAQCEALELINESLKAKRKQAEQFKAQHADMVAEYCFFRSVIVAFNIAIDSHTTALGTDLLVQIQRSFGKELKELATRRMISHRTHADSNQTTQCIAKNQDTQKQCTENASKGYRVCVQHGSRMPYKAYG